MITNVNLLPWRQEKIRVSNNIFAVICGVISIVVVVLAVFVNMVIKIRSEYTAKDINYVNKEVAIYQAKIQEINGLKERKKILVNRLQVINSLQADRSSTVNVLNQIIASIPRGVLLSEVRVQEKGLFISGKGQSNARVANLMKNLENSKFFSAPQLKQIKSSPGEDESLVTFEIEVEILG